MTEEEKHPAPGAEQPRGESALSTARRGAPPQAAAALFALMLSAAAGAGAYWITRGTESPAPPAAAEAAPPSEMTLRLPPVPPLPEPEATENPAAAAEPAPAPHEPTEEERRLAAPLAVAGPGIASGPASSAPATARDAPASARALPHFHLTLPAGSVIGCALATRIDTSAGGAAACRVTEDVWGPGGSVLLIPRGSVLTGEYRSGAPRGLARIHLLWSALTTPEGIRAELASEAADALGAAGVPGTEDAHWWARFGNALFFSTLGDGLEFASARATRASGGVNYYANTKDGLSELAGEAARDAGNIPATVTVPQGTELAVITSRDIDFSTVYRLRAGGDTP